VVRSALRRLWAGIPPRGPAGLVLLGLVGLGSALVTDRIGIHAIVGAFVGGVVVPREAAADLARRLKPVAVRLLPVFFAATGLRTRLALDAGTLAVTLGLAGLAYAAKFGATTLATRGTAGLGWSDAATVGHLTCAKGAIGFAVLEACRGAGLLDPRTYSVLAFVVAADTVMAAWAVRLQEGLPPRWRPPARAPCSAPP
jgi:Kef-type K+ transport system membrane component KefB